METPLVVVGSGGSLSDVLDIVESMEAQGGGWKVVGLLDDSRAPGSRVLDRTVLGPLAKARELDGTCYFINVIGSDRSFRGRPALLRSLGIGPDRFATLVHPSATVSPRARLGRGVYVAAGALVGGGVTIADHATLNPGCIVGHDAEVGEYTVIAPAAVVGGFVRVGATCYVGSGATVRQGLEIGEGALIGMGAVVTRSVPAGAVVVGSPARPLAPRAPKQPA